MQSEDMRSAVLGHLDRLNREIPALRKTQIEINSIKAEVATLHAKMAAGNKSITDADFARLTHEALNPW